MIMCERARYRKKLVALKKKFCYSHNDDDDDEMRFGGGGGGGQSTIVIKLAHGCTLRYNANIYQANECGKDMERHGHQR